MPARNKGRKRAYHHGDLHDALILAAASLIEEQGNCEFAMIDAARRAGVTSAAPYRHFRDRQALLDAVLELLFLGLTEAAAEACRGTRHGSEERIVALGRAYIRYLSQRPAFYQLMWGAQREAATPEAQPDTRSTGFQLLLDSVGAWCRENSVDDPAALELATRLWALAHGLMALTMHRHIERFLPEADVNALLERSTQAMLSGLRKAGS